MDKDTGLTDLQRHVLTAFFGLPQSKGYVLAGGAALLAAQLSDRPTQDLDIFGSDLEHGIAQAADAFEALCSNNAWPLERLHDSPTFRRLRIDTPDGSVLIDFAIDSPPTGPPHQTAVAPTYPPRELAARKILALFDRAAARDFADAHTLSRHFDLDELLDDAARLDLGFDKAVFASMLDRISRFTDEELRATGSDPTQLRPFFATWAERLRESG